MTGDAMDRKPINAFNKYLKRINASGERMSCDKCPIREKQHLIPYKWIICVPCSSFRTNNEDFKFKPFDFKHKDKKHENRTIQDI